MIERDPFCSLCRLSGEVTRDSEVCMMAEPQGGPVDLLVVTRLPLSSRQKAELKAYFEEAGIAWDGVVLTAVSRCRQFNVEPSKADIKACMTAYLIPEIEALKPKVVVAMGNEALFATTGRSGIMKYRAKEHQAHGTRIIPTISMSMVKRNPGQREGFIGDLRFIRRLLDGTGAPVTPPPSIRYVTSGAGLKALRSALADCSGAYFDIESNMFDEFKPESTIVSISFTVWG